MAGPAALRPAGESGGRPELSAAVAAQPMWYHTLDLGGGLVTPGWFDLRPIVDRMPWPDVRGKRCLDIGTYDGFLAFELERRGAGEVVATDLSDETKWDWPVELREVGPEWRTEFAGREKGRGFRIAREALGSSVERVELSVYELSPERLGSFDVVVCGSLLLHLRDPLRALEAVRAVCAGWFLSAEQVDPALSLLHRRRPLARIGPGLEVQWWVPNVAGHRQMVGASGFAVARAPRPYSIPFGAGHPPPGRGLRARRELALCRLLTGGEGVPHSALLARRAG